MPRFPLILPFLVVPLLHAQQATEATWVQDFAKAKAQAKAEKKHLLVDFTGSDWCHWCQKLDEEVLSKDVFKNEVPKSFVLVKLDFPQNEELVTKEIREQNDKLQQEYEIQGFPTILLMDCEGRPYAQTGYDDGGPEKYVGMLADMKKKGDAFENAMHRAAETKDAERAKALAEALDALEAEIVDGYHLATIEEIVKLDGDGKAGLRVKYEAKAKELAEKKALNAEMQAMQKLLGPLMQSGEGDKAIAALDDLIKAPKSVAQHQVALFFKGMVVMDTSGDAAAALALLEASKVLNPKSPLVKQIDMVVPRIKQHAAQKGEEKGEEKGGN
ncbi:MAG: thioredoxin family protein [Planctomycetes bacterium]|nr:thioredoxin family protein [Planctomycetota bacterium]